jgi:nucleoid-associated protein YgaU
MIQGPSAGPAMVLNLLLRWPILIPIFTLSSGIIIVYDEIDLPEIPIVNFAEIKMDMFQFLKQPPLIETNETNESEVKNIKVTVEPGDNLYRIAKKLAGQSAPTTKINDVKKQLMVANPQLQNLNRLKPGQVLNYQVP